MPMLMMLMCTIADKKESLRALFKEYERLSKLSGLELNADKTEVMRLGKNHLEKLYGYVLGKKL